MEVGPANHHWILRRAVDDRVHCSSVVGWTKKDEWKIVEAPPKLVDRLGPKLTGPSGGRVMRGAPFRL
jgi:hypothetical protein